MGSWNTVLSRLSWTHYLANAAESDFWPVYGWLITTSAAMMVSYAFGLPGAGVLLLLAVVHSCFFGGWKAGLASATLSVVYCTIYLSLPDQLLHYSDSGRRALLVNSAAAYGAVGLVEWLRRREFTARTAAATTAGYRKAEGESDRLFRETMDQAPFPVWIADRTGRRCFFNARWTAFTGSAAEDQAGEGWLALVHADDRAGVKLRYSNAVRSMERFDAEYRVRTANGEYRWIQDFAVPRIGRDGEYCGYIGSAVDRTERKRVESALHQLSGRLLELQDDERRRIARELHDTTAQRLAVVSMNLCVVRDKATDAAVRAPIAEALALAEQCSQEIRTLSYLLHPPLLDELGLMSALRSYAAGFTNRTGIAVELKTDYIGRLPRDIETTLFRIAQEALSNVHRHSGSARAEVRIIRDPRQVQIHIADDGRGVPDAALDQISEGGSVGVGIAGMRERARQLGGYLKVASSGQGTTITAVLPLLHSA